MMCFLPWTLLWSPVQNGCRNKNVTEHKAPTYRRAADTDYANECSTQPHYELWREVVFLGYFPDEVLLEVGKWVEVCGAPLQRIVKARKNLERAERELSLAHAVDIY